MQSAGLTETLGMQQVANATPAQAVAFQFSCAVGPGIVPAPPPTTGRIDIRVDNDILRNLDLTPAHDALREFIGISGEQRSVLFEVSRQAG
jgi:hypothetical protein